MTRTALITGGGGALAKALRAELELQGWQVQAPDRRALDATDPVAVRAFMDALPRLDLLVHNAGYLRDAPLARLSEIDFDAVLEVHLRAAFLCARSALRPMLRQGGGHLVFIGSFSALSGPAGQANYAAAKAGLIGLAQSLAAEYGARNVRANVVLPGLMETPMSAPLLADPERRQQALNAHTLGRFNTPETAARFIAFLDSLSHTSGQVFNLDSRVHPWT